VAQVRAIFFDAGGTLFTERASRAALYAEVAREHGLHFEEEAVAAAMKASHEALPKRVPGGFRYSRAWFDRFIVEVFERLGQPRLDPTLARDLHARFTSADSYRVFPDVVPALQQLKSMGLHCGVVSNWSEGLAALIEKLGLEPHLDFVIASALLEVEKPEPAIFRQALALARVRANEVVHVGDRIDRDITGAKSVGIVAVLLDRGRANENHPDRRVTTLAELPGLVRSLPR
jgi:putative hydrolase of the HAD superfamily